MDIKPLFKTTLTADVPAGRFPGQSFHPKGTELTMANLVESEKLGACSFSAPDPVFFYLNIAEENLNVLLAKLKEIEADKKPLLFKGKGIDKVISSLNHNLVYSYLQASFQFVIMLYIACEAFSNQHVPKLGLYTVPDRYGRPKTYTTKEDFERNASTKQKLVFIGQNLGLGHPNKQAFWSDFCILSGLRNEIVHLKTKGQSTFTAYQEIYKDLIDTDHNTIFESVKTLLQFFDSDMFE